MTMSAVDEEDALSLVVSLNRLLRSLRRAAGVQRLSPTALIVLAQLVECGPARLGTIAERVPCSQPTATTVVAWLESENYVQRQPDPADGRAILVALTDEGGELLQAFARNQAESLAERLSGLPAADRDRLLDADQVLRKLTEPGCQ